MRQGSIVSFQDYYALNRYLESNPWSQRFITKTEADIDKKSNSYLKELDKTVKLMKKDVTYVSKQIKEGKKILLGTDLNV